MKVKLQHICIVLALVAIVVTLCYPLVQFINMDYTSVTMTNFTLRHSDGTTNAMPWALGGLLIAAGLCQLFSLFIMLFRNYALQKRCLILGMLILTGWYILYLVFILILRDETVAVLPHWTMILPLISIILSFMAFNAIRRTEARIIASGNSFRLRD
jgi:hypothetical protein